MATSPNIETKRLVIVPFSVKHVTPIYLSWLNNAKLMRFSEQRHKNHSISSCKTYIRSFDNTANFFWAIEEKRNPSVHIGNMNAYINPDNSTADIGILIGEKKAQKKHYGFEAWIWVCRFLFEQCNVRKITAGAASINIPMLNLMQSAGMVDDGKRKAQLLINGQEVDVVHKALFKNEWKFETYSGKIRT
jgi:RimJ/RimL family protein N-acetyltransferase